MMKAWALASMLVAAGTAGDGETALARMRARQEAIRTLSASIEQVKSYPQLGIEDPAERGRLYLERGRDGDTKVRLEITSPERRVLIARQGGYLLYQPRIKQVVEGSLGGGGSKGLFSGVLTGSREAIEELERDYREEEIAPRHLRFTARPGAVVHCQVIELWLDEATWLPERQSCREANESVISITLRDIQLDGELPERVFDLDIPTDVERVKG